MCLCVLVKMQPAFLGAHPSATFNIVGKKKFARGAIFREMWSQRSLCGKVGRGC